jgi:formylmethanofuran dehydrogenase subunit A
VFLTTDHPNGGPFTAYPQLVRLLMERSFREDCLAQIHKAARKLSALGGLTREYSLREIAIMTRAAPARSLGLADRGHLAPGAAADIAVYRTNIDIEAMYAEPAHVFKGGVEVARHGRILATPRGATQTVRPDYDRQIEKRVQRFFDDHMTIGFDHFPLRDSEVADAGGALETRPCRVAGGGP